MNVNDILAQQQANLNAAYQSSQRIMLGVAACEIALFIFTCWVVYKFYARLRDIAYELRRFREAYESAQATAERMRSRVANIPASTTVSSNERADAKYMPKK